MCEPTTIALGVTAVVGAASAYSQAATAKAAGQSNAALADRAAAQVEMAGEQQVVQARRQGSLLLGSQRAALAGRGVELDSGTAQDVLDQTEFFGQQDQENARYNARQQAAQQRAQGANMRGAANAINPGASAGLSLLGSAAGAAAKWYSPGAAAGGGVSGTNDIAGVTGKNALDKWAKFGVGAD